LESEFHAAAVSNSSPLTHFRLECINDFFSLLCFYSNDRRGESKKKKEKSFFLLTKKHFPNLIWPAAVFKDTEKVKNVEHFACLPPAAMWHVAWGISGDLEMGAAHYSEIWDQVAA